MEKLTPEADAAEAARHVDETTKRCILALYRSAVRRRGRVGARSEKHCYAGARVLGRRRSVCGADVRRAPGEPYTGALRPVPGLLALVAAAASRRGGGRARSSLVVSGGRG